jgi:hypothetical protein
MSNDCSYANIKRADNSLGEDLHEISHSNDGGKSRNAIG